MGYVMSTRRIRRGSVEVEREQCADRWISGVRQVRLPEKPAPVQGLGERSTTMQGDTRSREQFEKDDPCADARGLRRNDR